MKVLYHVDLSEKTTFRVGGCAVNYYSPESIEDVVELVHKLKGQDYRIISGGSNLLINDQKKFEHVIYCGEFDKEITIIGDGKFYIGASNRIQKVIGFINENGYGGFEELIGLPAFFGGIIYMNAGIGGRGKEKFNICDFVERVKCVDRDTGEICWINKDDCNFAYRSSLFKKDQYIILGAEIKVASQPIEVSKERISNRRAYCKTHQEWGKGCFGTCFSIKNGRILNAMRRIPKIHRGGYINPL